MALRFEGLEVFQRAVDYAEACYRVSAGFPRRELFGLTSNLRRAALSISANIAEGAGRGTRRDFVHFLDIATGSLFETVATLALARRLGYVSAADFDAMNERADHLGRTLSRFKQALRARDDRRSTISDT